MTSTTIGIHFWVKIAWLLLLSAFISDKNSMTSTTIYRHSFLSKNSTTSTTIGIHLWVKIAWLLLLLAFISDKNSMTSTTIGIHFGVKIAWLLLLLAFISDKNSMNSTTIGIHFYQLFAHNNLLFACSSVYENQLFVLSLINSVVQLVYLYDEPEFPEEVKFIN